ncbi:hypothetical protein PBI_SCTP2_514 [Salicola phage SCTP-2]|nr:hypothetical protein PBI_SCTP2_514 [Salicola phage SCTP-2]
MSIATLMIVIAGCGLAIGTTWLVSPIIKKSIDVIQNTNGSAKQ